MPWTERWTTTDDKGVRYEHETLHRLVLLPESLRVTAKLETETRRRGIYGVPVYGSTRDSRGASRSPTSRGSR